MSENYEVKRHNCQSHLMPSSQILFSDSGKESKQQNMKIPFKYNTDTKISEAVSKESDTSLVTETESSISDVSLKKKSEKDIN